MFFKFDNPLFLLPMTNDSTTSCLTNLLRKSPSQSTLMFIRQFARVYVTLGNGEPRPLVLN